jgi:DNA polymerase-3 subunit alpha
MDFLGLRNLSVIAGALRAINKKRKKQNLEPITMDDIPITDPYAYRHIQSGKTVGVFQLESGGMTNLVSETYMDIENFIQKYEENPTVNEKGIGVFDENYDALFERLIALISLYRPGPMDEIPNYLHSMNNPQDVKYDTPELESILGNTYGILVYQEQVMHAVRKLAGFSAGQADVIRKAMGEILPHYRVIYS